MTLNSPIAAMLWENWRLSRVEAVWRFGVGMVAASGAMAFLGAPVNAAFVILIVVNSMFWFSISRLNGGRFVDGYKPGFPFYLLYTNPVSTRTSVAVAMLYDAISGLALYLVSAALLGYAFGQQFPLFSVTLWMLACHLACTCIQWSTRNRAVQWTGSIVIGWPLYFLLIHAASPELRLQFSVGENVLLVSICVLSLILAVAGVSQQRRGDAIASAPRAVGSPGYPFWLVNLFRFPCPTSSATRAQLWFELKSSGLPVLMIGLAVALLIFVLSAISITIAPARTAAIAIIGLSVPVLLIALGGNAFGIRRKQGRRYTSAFEATQPSSTAQLASLKVLVRAGCVLVALTAIAASVWACSSFLGAWGTWTPEEGKNVLPELVNARQKVAAALAGLTPSSYAALTIVAAIAVGAIVAWQAVREALRARYPRPLFVLQALPVVWSLVVIVLTFAIRKGFGPVPLVGQIVMVTFWITAAVMVLATIYLAWSGFVERVLTIRYACGALTIAVAFCLLWIAGTSATFVVEKLWLALLILTIGLLAPWSLNRARHL
jgi:hypothetical protein